MPAIKRTVAVVGSAGGDLSPEARAKCRELGREIGRRGLNIVTGACPGLPQEAAFGARETGALTIGISPALCLDEHRNRYHSPYEEYDVLIYTGAGLMGREVDVIRTGHLVVVVGGRSGTLGEFAIAYDDGNVIAALLGTGGVADQLETIVAMIHKDTGTEMVYSGDPAELLEQALALHDRRIAEGRAYTINEYPVRERG